VAGAGRRVSVDLLVGYRYAQVFAPKDTDYMALEPMTAPMSALTSGRGLRVVAPGGQFRAAFRIRVSRNEATIPELAGDYRPSHGCIRTKCRTCVPPFSLVSASG
jgi:hypothetical protein